MKRVVILGADGFIGRHLAFGLRAAGWQVIAHARRTAALEAMGFATIRADLTDPQSHDPAFWRPHLSGAALVNAAGLLTGPDRAMEAVHSLAPRAAMAACDGPKLLISAVGIDSARTGFARHRRAAEQEARRAGATILRPGLVMADSSYGGSSLLRALAVLPACTPVVGAGTQPFNPIHASDLAEAVAACLETPPGPGPSGPQGAWEIGGPETLSQSALIQSLRGWLGRPPVPLLRIPMPLARLFGRLGDALRLGPVSATAVAQLDSGVLADPAPLLRQIPTRPRAASLFLHARPAGTQDLWQARLYLMKPAIRLVLALMWLVSGLLGLFLPAESFVPALAPLPETPALILARAGGLADLALALALLRDWRPRLTAGLQLAMVAGYTLGLSLIAPVLWLAPFGGLLKNLPVMALILTYSLLIRER